MAILRFIPMFAIMLVVYFVFGTGGEQSPLGNQVMGGTMMSGAEWMLTRGDLLVVIGVFALYIELFKATRTGAATVVDHSLSMLVFIAYIVLFITVQAAATPVFLILGLMAFVDVIAGFTITIAASRRDVALGAAIG